MKSIPDHIKQTEESIKFCTIIDKYCAELSKLCFKMLDDIDYLTKTYNITKYRRRIEAAMQIHQEKRYTMAFELYVSILSDMTTEMYNPEGKVK